LFVEAIAKYCPFPLPGGTEQPFPEAVLRSGPIEHSTR
jgi:hypothetical protein